MRADLRSGGRRFPKVGVPCLWGAALALLTACGGGAGDDPFAALTPGPVQSFRAADLVFGQAGFNGHLVNRGVAKPNADSLDGPGAPAPDLSGAGVLYLPDIGNNRVLGFDQAPVFNNLAANFVLGQPGFTFNDANVGPTALSAPVAAVSEGDVLYVSDYGNDRVLIWPQLPSSTAAPASVVVGQPDLASKGHATSATGLDGPVGICAAAGRLLVADSGNHRVLIWATPPMADGAPADLVLGQADFTSGLPNRGGAVSGETLFEPFAVWSDGERVAVADRGNNRVLIWNTFPTTNGAPADLVLGQPDFTTSAPGAGASGLNGPTAVASDFVRLLVGDAGNNRVLVWPEFPTASAEPAGSVIGQSDFDHGAPNDDDQDGFPDAAPTARTLSSGTARILTVCLAGPKIYIGDTGNNRMLIYEAQ